MKTAFKPSISTLRIAAAALLLCLCSCAKSKEPSAFDYVSAEVQMKDAEDCAHRAGRALDSIATNHREIEDILDALTRATIQAEERLTICEKKVSAHGVRLPPAPKSK